MASEEPNLDEQISQARSEVEAAKKELGDLDTEISRFENEQRTVSAIGDRDVSNLERQAQDSRDLGELHQAREYQEEAADRRVQLAKRINELEDRLGTLRGDRIGLAATQNACESRLDALKERAEEQAARASISEEQVRRAADLEERLERIEKERSDLIARVEQYAPLVEAQREATVGSGSAELSKAYADQADDYMGEWKIW